MTGAGPPVEKQAAKTGGDLSMRDSLVRLLEEGHPDFRSDWRDDTSLIRSGLMDSLGLFNLALWIEQEIRSKLDLASLDPSKEWDTIADILDFVRKHRR